MFKKLAVMTAVSFAAMYGLMYVMVNSFENVYPSWNQAYMAAVMTAAMVIIELMVMKDMYQDARRNVVIGVSILVLALGVIFIRTQFAISEKDFLRSMISHHASALLMCSQNTNLQDPEVELLCQSILKGQQSEIDFMRAKLLSK